MENKINVAELLKDCPKGMELDCTMYNNLEFDCIDEDSIFSIKCISKGIDGTYYNHSFTKYGGYDSLSNAKCVIFPKGKTTWKEFHRPFVEGDIIYAEDDYSDATFTYVAILKRIENENGYLEIYSHCFYNYEDNYFSTGDFPYDGFNIKFATEKEKAELFRAIKDNGYRWDTETKTLEKLVVPEFKVGNNVREKNDKSATFTISDIDDSCYYCGDYVICNICDQDNWELVPNKFDINTLKPFDKVLYRMHCNDTWLAGFYNVCIKNKIFVIGLGAVPHYIPYENNEHLLGTTNDCDDFYKTWEK